MEEYSEDIKYFYEKDLEEDKMDGYNQLLEQCDDYKNYQGVDCTVSKNEDALVIFIKIKVADLDVNGKVKFRTNYTYDEWKEYLGSSGYTCK